MNSTAITLGFLEIKWYSIFILFAICVASTIIFLEAFKKKINKETMLDIIFYGLIVGILGARIYYVLFNLDYYLSDPIEIISMWHGGLAIHGGLIATLIFLYFYTKKNKMNLLLLLDIIVVGVIMAQAIGRWGNFFNGEAFGRVVTKTFLENMHLPKFIIKGMYIDGNYREPTFLYESVFNIIGFIILLLLRKTKKLHTGTLTGIYMIWYGIVRLIIETFRSDSLMISSIKVAQLISIIGITIGIIVIIISIKNKEKYSKDSIIESN